MTPPDVPLTLTTYGPPTAPVGVMVKVYAVPKLDAAMVELGENAQVTLMVGEGTSVDRSTLIIP